jgi:hypothetical protein
MNKSPFLHLPDGFPWSHCVGAGANCGLLDDVTGAIFRNRSGEMGHVMPKTDWNGKFNMEHLDFLHGKKNLIWIFTLQKKNCKYGRSGFLHCKKQMQHGHTKIGNTTRNYLRLDSFRSWRWWESPESFGTIPLFSDKPLWPQCGDPSKFYCSCHRGRDMTWL